MLRNVILGKAFSSNILEICAGSSKFSPTALLSQQRQFSIGSCLAVEKRPVYPKLKESYHHGLSSHPLIGLTVGDALLRSTKKAPERECVVFCDSGMRRTFAEFNEEVDRLAAGLLQLGFQKGDRVGIWGPNTLEWVLTQFATARIGAILVSVNPSYRTHEMEYALNLVGCKGLITPATYKTQKYYDMLREVAPDIERCQPGQLKSKRIPDLRTVIMADENHYDGTFKFNDVMSAAGPLEISSVHNMSRSLQFDDPINIQFTSGTTGHPKGATLTHHNIVNNAKFIGNRVGFDEEDHRVCCQVPLYHCYGMVGGMVCMAVHGTTIVFPSAGYDPQATMDSLVKEKCTTIYGTPTMYIDVCSVVEKSGVKLPHLTRGTMAGAFCPPEVVSKSSKILGINLAVSGLDNQKK